MAAPQRLSGVPRVAFNVAHQREQRREKRVADRRTHRSRQIRHLARVGEQPTVILRRELLGAECGQAEVGHCPGACSGVEIAEMARGQPASWRFEDQFLFHQASNVKTIQVTAADGSTPSIRSISPPWPGSRVPISLIPRSRLT